MSMMNGISHIAETFAAVRAEGRAALMPYLTLGFPTPAASLEILAAVAGAGADLIELGIPFSDPLADGPTIQSSTQTALEQGMDVHACLAHTAIIRQQGLRQPLLLMGYYNPVLAYGIERFICDAAAAGADGFIIPDLPPEEASQMEAACQAYGMALVYLLSPTSTSDRIARVAAHTTGFLYLVSVTGVTGARKELPSDLAGFINRVRLSARVPLAIGFGIATPEQARTVGKMADGVIVGSALIDTIQKAADPARAAEAFVRSLRAAL